MKKSCIVLLIVILALTPPEAQGQGERIRGTELNTIIEEIALDVSALRGLDFETPARCSVKSRGALRKHLQSIIKEEIPEGKLRAYQKALARFGLIPKDLSLEDFLLDLYIEQVVGLYDWRTKTLYLVDDMPETVLNAVISHELTHALQDQYVGMKNLPSSYRGEDDDRIMATQALLEGDAISVMIDYTLIDAEKATTIPPDIELLVGEFMDTVGGRLMASAPPYIRQNVLFPYIHGFAFVRRLRESGGWDMVNNTLEHPPSSTEQILHPEKYLGMPDLPTTINLPLLTEELGEGWMFLDQNTLGEFNTNILLEEFLEEVPNAAAVGWDGDLYQIYEQKTSGQTALVWFTTWDSPTDAWEFFESYSAALTKKYGPGETKAHTLHLPIGNETCVYMELRDKDVLVLDGIPEASAARVAAQAWRATKVERN